MRKTIVAGNWKMNKLYPEVISFLTSVVNELSEMELTDVISIIAPPFVYLHDSQKGVHDTSLKLSAQNVSPYEFGAYTGDISVPMLVSIGIEYSIVGHSERREYYGDTDESIGKRAELLLKHHLSPIICIGEKEEEREMGMTEMVLKNQLQTIFSQMTIDDPAKIIIAYEPVWAIGTGKTATPKIAQEAHHFIRNWLTEKYSQEFATAIPILYGGSVKPDNFAELLAQEDIDGGLIGGASLKSEDYLQLLKIAINMRK